MHKQHLLNYWPLYITYVLIVYVLYKHNIIVQGLILQDVYSNIMMCTIYYYNYDTYTYNIVITIYIL